MVTTKERHSELQALEWPDVLVGPATETIPRKHRLGDDVRFLTFLYQLAAGLGRTLDVDEIAMRALRLASGVSCAEGGGLVLVDSGRATVAIPCFKRWTNRVSAQSILQILKLGLAVLVTRQQRSVVITDIRSDPRYQNLPDGPERLRSVLCLPLLHEEKLRGILVLTHSEPRHFSAEHLELLTAGAPQIAAALANALKYREALQERARLETILKSMPEALLVLDPQGQVTLANHSLERLTGRAVQDLLGLPFSDAVPLQYDSGSNPIDQVLQGSYASFEMDVWLQEADGKVPVRLGCAALPGMHGRRGGAVVVLRDIRYLKEVEGMREDLSHMLIHDLKAPLSAIGSTIQMLQQYLLQQYQEEKRRGGKGGPSTPWAGSSRAAQIDDDSIRTMLGIADKGVWRLSGMIDSILDIQRLEAGQFPFSVAPLNLPEVISQVVKEAAVLIRENNIRVELDIPPDLPRVAADREAVRRVLWNLLDNAVKYTPAGGCIHLQARPLQLPLHICPPPASPRAAPAHWVVVGVQDSGPGIPHEDQERIFSKFAQGRIGRSRRRGTGLGLTFCRLAVEAHGGSIWVNNGPEGGSVFSFSLPTANG